MFLQGYYMPSIFPVYENYKAYLKELTVIRLHGPDRAAIEKKTKGNWDTIVEPKDDELADLTDMLQQLWREKVEVHLYVNNHYEGSAPKTIERIEELLR